MGKEDRLWELTEGRFLSPTNISRHLCDRIISPRSKKEYLSFEQNGYPEMKLEYNAAMTRLPHTPMKLFVVSTVRIVEGEEVLVRYDIRMWRHIFYCQFINP